MPLTIFTLPKPFAGHIGIIQRNAIRSWLALDPAPEIILCGDEDGVAEAAAEFGLRHISELACNEFGTPLLDSLFSSGGAAANDIIAYINADMILLPDFLQAVDDAASQIPGPFLLTGDRTELEIHDELQFDPESQTEILAEAIRNGRLISPAYDYFVFRREHPVADIPPFAVGRLCWDIWLVYESVRQKIKLIDGTAQITAIHQNHDYMHTVENIKNRKSLNSHNSEEVAKNRKLCGYSLFKIFVPCYTLYRGGISFSLAKTSRFAFYSLRRRISWLIKG